MHAQTDGQRENKMPPVPSTMKVIAAATAL